MKRFTIIIPAYNCERYIRKCLQYISRQTFNNFEIVIVNDGSTDNTENEILDIKATSMNLCINYVYQKNAGAGAARNTGLEHASGEYIVFIDADDYVDDDFLFETNKIIEERKSDLIFIDIVREDENGKGIRYEKMSDYSHLNKDSMLRWQLTGKMPWGGVRKVLRRSLVKDYDLRYATSIRVGEESIYSFKALYHAEKIAFQTKALYHYVDCSTSLTSNDSVENSQSVFNFIHTFFQEHKEYKGFEPTIRALAATTVVIVINVMLAKGIDEVYKESKAIMKKYEQYTKGSIDTSSLDMRVKMCIPWIKLGWPLPILMASKLQRLYKTLR